MKRWFPFENSAALATGDRPRGVRFSTEVHPGKCATSRRECRSAEEDGRRFRPGFVLLSRHRASKSYFLRAIREADLAVSVPRSRTNWAECSLPACVGYHRSPGPK